MIRGKIQILSAGVGLTLCVFFFGCTSPDLTPGEGCILVYGDSRTNHFVHQDVVDLMVQSEPVAVFHTGDLVEDGLDPEQWEIFFHITEALMRTVEFYPALGNHEKNSPIFFEKFDLPNNERWYCVDLDPIHFVVLDSNADTEPTSNQYLWLVDDLGNLPDHTKFVIVLFHHPPYSSGRHGGDEKGLINTWVPVFESRGVDLVFNGHDHNYERSLVNSVYYIVSGGGGAPLYGKENFNPYSQVFIKSYHFCRLSLEGDRLDVEVISRDGETIDLFSVYE